MGIRYKVIGFKLLFILFFLSIGLVFPSAILAGTAPGSSPVNQPPTGLGNAFNDSAGSPLNATAVQGGGFNTSATFDSIIGKVITMVLELMGVIFLILAIYGGFKWMTAAGNEETVEKAKKTIINAIIGLIVVLAAFVIAKFVAGTLGDIVFK